MDVCVASAAVRKLLCFGCMLGTVRWDQGLCALIAKCTLLLILTSCSARIGDPPNNGAAGTGSGATGEGGRGGDETGLAESAGPSESGDRHTVSTGPAIGRRLSDAEYFNTIEVATGVDLSAADFSLPRDERPPAGFRNQVVSQLLSPGRITAYAAIASSAVEQADWGALLSMHAACTELTAACQQAFVDSLGLSLLRRPVSDRERSVYASMFDRAVEQGEGFAVGAKLVARVMLQSPRFVYRFEQQRATSTAGPVDDYELATRLSFLVWNAGPDRELLDLAAAGTLVANIEAQVDRLLAHPRARRALRQYIEQWLYLDAIPPGLELAPDMKEEIYRLFEWLVWERQTDLMQAFTLQRAELSGTLASFYGLETQGSSFAVYDLAAKPERIGFLTTAALMAARTVNPSTSMIDRGLFVLNDLLCDSVPPPEGEELESAIEANTVPETSGLSQRQRFAKQSEQALCASCHGKIDNLGLPFENFGAAGNYMQIDQHGNPLTGSGVVAIGDLDTAYANVADFATALSKSQSVARCLVQKSLEHAYGRTMARPDQGVVDDLFAAFVARGRSYQALLRAIAVHPNFRLIEGANE